MDDTAPKLSKALKTYRQQRGLSQRELAARAGVHHTSISKWESGHRTPPLSYLHKLIDIGVLVPPIHLLDGDTIRTWRLQQGYSQPKLGALLGVHQSTVSAWENTAKKPRYATALRLVALGCPLPAPPRPQYAHDGSPNTPPASCEACPSYQTCLALSKMHLWCLCETEPPTLADLVRAHRLSWNSYPINKQTLHEAASRVPLPPPSPPPWEAYKEQP